MEISDRGFWTSKSIPDGYPFDKSLTNYLAKNLFANKIIGDFGCGRGVYVNAFNSQGVECHGYDGNPLTLEINPQCHIVDLSKPIKLEQKFHWLLSLEVGEHIPKEYEQIFLDNLSKNNTEGIVLSWAIVGQGGYGHVNEQPNTYIKKKMKDLGYRNDILTEISLRSICDLQWLKKTLMVFKRIIF